MSDVLNHLATADDGPVNGHPGTAAEFAARITERWRASVESIIEAGRILVEAKNTLAHGDFSAMCRNQLPFSQRTAERLMAIARDQRLSNPTISSFLPASWTVLYDLTTLTDAEFSMAIDGEVATPSANTTEASGTAREAPGGPESTGPSRHAPAIRTDGGEHQVMSAQETDRGEAEHSSRLNLSSPNPLRAIMQKRKQERRETREKVLAGVQLAMPQKRFGVILADPEWRFEVYSRETGLDRAADNHYPTSATDVIASRPVDTIAADDCCLFLWATVPMLPDALRVMEAWGFAYKSHFIWNKDKIGTGYWNRNKHELLLVGTRGNIPAPAMGEQAHSVIDAPVRLHSEKPASFYLLIEGYFPTLPKIELNARRARAGWERWGNEAPAESEAAA